jgi:NDP-sugar pyrophosphorylase family protein
MNDDILTDLSYREPMHTHVAGDPALTIATYQRDHQVSLGVIEHDRGVVTDYIEKPIMHYEVSMGIYVYSPRVLDKIPKAHFDFPDVVRALLRSGETARTRPFDGMWFDIGTPGDYDRAVATIGGRARSLLRRLIQPSASSAKPSRTASTTRASRSSPRCGYSASVS